MKRTLPRWYIKQNRLAHGELYCEDGERAVYLSGQHCVACAYSKVIGEYGGDCDLRGLSRYGRCFQFLSMMVRHEREDAKNTKS